MIALVLVVGLAYYFNNSYASSGEDNAKASQSAKEKQQVIKHNLTSYLNSVTKDGSTSVSFYNLGAESGSKDDKVYKKGSLQVESNAHSVQTAASTYKLYIAAFLMNQKLKGNFSWTADNVDGFNKMIVKSENDFSEAQIDTYGSYALNNFVASQGWYTGVFQDGQGTETTSYSLQLLLEDLEAGTGAFQNKSDQNRILKLMGKQIYRDGIPDGAAKADQGTTVQDKVGFLDDVNNDAAIVTMPNGQKYILVILTHGHNQSGFSGFSKISKIAKKVQDIVYGDNAGNKVVDY